MDQVERQKERHGYLSSYLVTTHLRRNDAITCSSASETTPLIRLANQRPAEHTHEHPCLP